MATKIILGFKRGTKVVPKSKSVWGNLGTSVEWLEAQIKSQPYLYVVDEDSDGPYKYLVLSATDGVKESGDFFLPSDVEIYKEEKANANNVR